MESNVICHLFPQDTMLLSMVFFFLAAAASSPETQWADYTCGMEICDESCMLHLVKTSLSAEGYESCGSLLVQGSTPWLASGVCLLPISLL